MPRGVRKSDLPEKLCVTCGRPFRWRRKWARSWDEVRHCSERCRKNRAPGRVAETDKVPPQRR